MGREREEKEREKEKERERKGGDFVCEREGGREGMRERNCVCEDRKSVYISACEVV